MRVSQLKKSNFLTKADVGPGVLVTIKEVFEENIAKDGAPQEIKWCMSFEELEKPMVLNSTNGQILESILKSDNSDDWIGHKVVAYDEPNVSYGGKLTGGIRFRAPRNQPTIPRVAPKPIEPDPARVPDNDVPF